MSVLQCIFAVQSKSTWVLIILMNKYTDTLGDPWNAALIIFLYLPAPRTTMVDFVNDFLVWITFLWFP